MNLPGRFVQTIQAAFGERGRLFLESLPDLVAETSRCWQLTDVTPVPTLSYNYVAFARRLDRDVVLKIGVPEPELTSELSAHRLFDGRRCVRLLEADAARGMCLLERLLPGEMLVTLADDDRATRIAAELMLGLWRPAPSDPSLIRLSDWFKGLDNLRRHFDGATGPLPASLVERAEAASRAFFAETYAPMLIHGDLHHFNILSSDRTWLAIDPKGVIGPSAYEVGPFLMNPWCVSGLEPDTAGRLQRRLLILSEILGQEVPRLREWGIAYAVLSAWWSLSVGEDWRPVIECARLLSSSH